MTRYRMLAVMAMMFITPAAAQMTVPKVSRPNVLQPLTVSPNAETTLEPWMTPETAKKTIEELRLERTQLKTSLSEALARIDAITQPGGSLVRAYCASHTVSKNTAGAEENCAASGYSCDQVSGQCHRTATSGDMCSEGFNMDATNGRCIKL